MLLFFSRQRRTGACARSEETNLIVWETMVQWTANPLFLSWTVICIEVQSFQIAIKKTTDHFLSVIHFWTNWIALAQTNVYYFISMTLGAGCHGDTVPLSKQVLPFHAQHPNAPLISNVCLQRSTTQFGHSCKHKFQMHPVYRQKGCQSPFLTRYTF